MQIRNLQGRLAEPTVSARTAGQCASGKQRVGERREKKTETTMGDGPLELYRTKAQQLCIRATRAWLVKRNYKSA